MNCKACLVGQLNQGPHGTARGRSPAQREPWTRTAPLLLPRKLFVRDG